MKTTLKTHCVLITSAMLLAACGTTTPYKAPTLDTAHLTILPSVDIVKKVQLGAPPALWWTQLGDPQLDQLVKLAWKGNYDLRIAAARLASAREQLQVAKAAGLPAVSLDASASRTQLATVESRSGELTVVNPMQWQSTLSFELDIFGRVRHSIEASKASEEEREALHNDVRRLILAQVVDSYLELRSAQMLSICIQEQTENQIKTLDLVRQRENAGRASQSERLRFEAQVGLVRSRLPGLQAQERAARNRLATLTGLRLDAPALANLNRPMELTLPTTVVVDEPAGLLLRRPDVRAAERELAVATAREGVALADLYPRISLGALLGNSGVAGDWLGSDSARWRVGSSFSLPLFDGGTRRAQLRNAGAEVQAAGAKFEKSIAVALEETDTAISSWTQMARRHSELMTADRLTQESARLTRVRYSEGAESLLGVLDSDRNALVTQEQLVIAKRDLAVATSRTYVAVAGGYDVSE